MIASKRHKRSNKPQRSRALSSARVTAMIEEATVDAYGQEEQATGWLTVFEENLEIPFETTVLGVDVTVKRLELRDDNAIVAICQRGKARQAIGIVDLPLPSAPPRGAEWLEAYRRWRGDR